MHLERIRCTDIHPDPRSVRSAGRDSDALTDSIRLHGVLRPVLLKATSDGYVIVHGERRWRAALMAGLDTIPATIVQDVVRAEGASPDSGAQQAA
jgi:ParB family transcriptional regulator, chromosome partitioning protein